MLVVEKNYENSSLAQQIDRGGSIRDLCKLRYGVSVFCLLLASGWAGQRNAIRDQGWLRKRRVINLQPIVPIAGGHMINRFKESDSREGDVVTDRSDFQNVGIVNAYHSRQDIHREREFDAGRTRYRFALRLIEPTSQSLRVADVGGGAGEFAALLRDLGYRTVLVDGNQSSVEREIRRGSEAIYADLN